MKNKIRTLALLSFAILIGICIFKCTTKKAVENAQKEIIGNSEENYKEFCASCHGEKIEAFINRDVWVYGADRESMFKIIKFGKDDIGMPGYAEALNDSEVYEVVDYILSAIENKKSREFSSGENDDITFVSEGMKLKLELISEVADSPWGITQSKNGVLFFTDKQGLLFSKKEKESAIKINGVPEVRFKGQGGLMDVKLHPDFENNKRIYLTYSKPHPSNNNLSTTAVYSGILNNNSIQNGKDIFIAQPYVDTYRHYGSRMIFDNDGYLFLAIGERGRRDDYPQKLDNHLGKILRLNDDGTIPADNPFYHQENAKKEIYSYGHRNPQGLCYDAENNKIYDNEHGPRGGDEINLIQAGKNYGWPVITYGINYVGTKITDLTHKEGMEQPEHYWVPSIAVCGMDFVSSNKYPKWKGDILSGSLKFDYINRNDLSASGEFLKEEKLFPTIGRLRSISQCSDGYIYFGVENPGKIYKVVPVE